METTTNGTSRALIDPGFSEELFPDEGGSLSGYTITYYINGYGTQPSNEYFKTALPNPLPVLVDNTMSFEGWYTDASLTTKAVAGKSISANQNLYAKWVAYTFTISRGALPTWHDDYSMNSTDRVDFSDITITLDDSHSSYNFTSAEDFLTNPSKKRLCKNSASSNLVEKTAKVIPNYKINGQEKLIFKGCAPNSDTAISLQKIITPTNFAASYPYLEYSSYVSVTTSGYLSRVNGQLKIGNTVIAENVPYLVYFELIAGGGGGGGSDGWGLGTGSGLIEANGHGGGSGAAIAGILDFTTTGTFEFWIGTGGSAGASGGNNGGDGGTSIIKANSSSISIPGGKGGSYGNNSGDGKGGTFTSAPTLPTHLSAMGVYYLALQSGIDRNTSNTQGGALSSITTATQKFFGDRTMTLFSKTKDLSKKGSAGSDGVASAGYVGGGGGGGTYQKGNHAGGKGGDGALLLFW